VTRGYAGRPDLTADHFRPDPFGGKFVLAGHPAIRDAAVAARRNCGEVRLITYAVPRDPVTVEELRAWLQERLPEPMIPAGWVLLDALPLTPNGKVDLAALPEPDTARPSGEHLPPRDDVERNLAAIWEELLDVRPAGVQDDFFALGAAWNGHRLRRGGAPSEGCRAGSPGLGSPALPRQGGAERLAEELTITASRRT